jgi:oligoendopeptidase F
MLQQRKDVKTKDTWDLSPMYASLSEWEEEFEATQSKENSFVNKILSYKGRLNEGPGVVKEFIEYMMKMDRLLSKLMTYAHLIHDQDVGEDASKNAYGKIRHLAHEFSESLSWFEPELLQLSPVELDAIMDYDSLKEFRVFFDKILRLKPHTLSKEQEEILSYAGKIAQGPYLIFSSFNNADLKFKKAHNEEGKEFDVSHGSYHLYMESKDRALRKSAFESMHQAFQAYENTLVETLQSQVHSHVFYAKSRKYPSSLQAALFPHQIEVKVYENLIKTVKSRLDVMHRYVSARKAFLGLDKVYAYDMYVPCVKDVTMRFSYEEAVDLIIEAVAILGKEYQHILKQGLTSQRWVDRYENLRKRSGAYSSGCYDSYPYILMNYQGTLSDVLTLAHEAGHSMHSYLSCKNQPYQYSSYTIFVAEVASTFNEELVFRCLLNKVKSLDEKKYLINKRIDGIRGTLFRQTLFAEFELKIHHQVEKGTPLTPKFLKQLYATLNRDYYGSDFCHADLVEYEFMRIPHFYSNFYVYQYATGISAALALVDKVTSENNPKKYLEFLSSGSKDYSLNLLKQAGVDMTSSLPINVLINQFDHLVKELFN